MLRKVQKTQLEILIELDRICNKYNIKYQLFSGTLLGAIRHKGFIPWDDDIDVCMPRKDYEKFQEICKHELNSSYFLQNYENDAEYIMQFAKIRKNNTTFVEKATSETKIHKGIYIDVFPLDNVEPHKLIGKGQYFLVYLLGRLNLTRIKMLSQNTENYLKKYFGVISYYILKIIPKNITDVIQYKVNCMFGNRTTKYVNHLTNGISKKRWNMFLREASTFENTILVDFEGYQFPAPANYHDVLTKHYGDYMVLPPKNKRVPHHDVIQVKFNNI